MILSRAPVRFSLGGGGTDLPSYASEHGGFVIAAAIRKHVSVSIAKRFQDDIVVAHESTQTVDAVEDIAHPIVRAAMRATGTGTGVQIHTWSDVPGNTGLGSSSTFTVALLAALHAHHDRQPSAEALAREASHVELELLGEPIGKQDQYISSYGGICAFTFERDGRVVVERLPLMNQTVSDFESRLVVYYSGIRRSASVILREQGQRIRDDQELAVARMHRIKALGHETRRILLRGTLDEYGELLDEHWTMKRKLASGMSDSVIDEHYDTAIRAGALGGKLMGAGGGGFFLFYVRADRRSHVDAAMARRGLRALPFRFDFEGARVLADFRDRPNRQTALRLTA